MHAPAGPANRAAQLAHACCLRHFCSLLHIGGWLHLCRWQEDQSLRRAALWAERRATGSAVRCHARLRGLQLGWVPAQQHQLPAGALAKPRAMRRPVCEGSTRRRPRLLPGVRRCALLQLLPGRWPAAHLPRRRHRDVQGAQGRMLGAAHSSPGRRGAAWLKHASGLSRPETSTHCLQVGAEVVRPCAWWQLPPFSASACPLSTDVSILLSGKAAYLYSSSAQPPSATANACAGTPVRRHRWHAFAFGCPSVGAGSTTALAPCPLQPLATAPRATQGPACCTARRRPTSMSHAGEPGSRGCADAGPLSCSTVSHPHPPHACAALEQPTARWTSARCLTALAPRRRWHAAASRAPASTRSAWAAGRSGWPTMPAATAPSRRSHPSRTQTARVSGAWPALGACVTWWGSVRLC